MASTRFLLVRHGQSEWNATGRWQGQADPPLSSLGRAQAASAVAGLPPFDLLASSALRRASHTAEIIASEIGHDLVHVEPRLVERAAGGFSGLTRAEIEVEYPGYLEAGRWPEGWESDESLVERVAGGLGAIAAMVGPGATVVVVTHAGCIYGLEGALEAPFERIPNLGGRWFDLEDGTFKLGARVHLLDEADETVPDQI
jgi:probable phosphoglycerate mutase